MKDIRYDPKNKKNEITKKSCGINDKNKRAKKDNIKMEEKKEKKKEEKEKKKKKHK